jgi:hypothetical protein
MALSLIVGPRRGISEYSSGYVRPIQNELKVVSIHNQPALPVLISLGLDPNSSGPMKASDKHH